MSHDDDYSVSSQTLTSLTGSVGRPHVVILGAGASVAAFPNGDRARRRLPLMNDLAAVIGVDDVIKAAGLDPKHNFESLYSELHRRDPNAKIVADLERAIEEYFGAMSLPDSVTLYDYLVLSLREKDAIFTFNWDPFLVDTVKRHAKYAKLPHIFHLHGNVRIAWCDTCKISTWREPICLACGNRLEPSRLLFPVENKNYADDPLIESQWKAAREFIRDAFLVTIFGYSAPPTDVEAMSILRDSWKGVSHDRLVDRVEIIDVKNTDDLAEQWSDFSFYHHYDIGHTFFESWLARYPRRTCEAWYHMGVEGKFTHFLPWTTNLEGLQQAVETLQTHEPC